MKNHGNTLATFCVALAALTLTACGNGGTLSLEGSPRKVATQGSPFVGLNLGGKALVVQQGQTPQTGIHGWIAVQAISAQSQKSSNNSGITATINQVQGGVQ